ncbi:MAG: hypothetical protein Q4E06_08720 [Lautropia sp.]|nr:hypothetical protein [Lautropia sp.]
MLFILEGWFVRSIRLSCLARWAMGRGALFASFLLCLGSVNASDDVEAGRSGSIENPMIASLKIKQGRSHLARIGVEPSLKALLGARYDEFLENFQDITEPTLLKDGGYILDGWRHIDYGREDIHPFDHSEVFIYYPDGRVYAAWYNKDEGVIHYAGERSGPIHAGVDAWARRFYPPILRVK